MMYGFHAIICSVAYLVVPSFRMRANAAALARHQGVFRSSAPVHCRKDAKPAAL